MPFPDLYRILEKDFTQIGASANVYLETLSLGAQNAVTGWYAKTFVETTIKGLILPKGLSLTLLKYGLQVMYDAVFITKTAVVEGDEIKDLNDDRYLVVGVLPRKILDQTQFYVAQLQLLEWSQRRIEGGAYLAWTGPNSIFERAHRFYEQNGLASATVTLKALYLGDQDSETGWYKKYSYDDVPITVIIVQGDTKLQLSNVGLLPQKTITGYTLDKVVEGDGIVGDDWREYLVKGVTPHLLGDRLAFLELDLAYLGTNWGGGYESSLLPGGEVMNCTDVRACLEGNYSTYAVYDSFDDATLDYALLASARANCLETKAILLTTTSTYYMKVYDIDAKTVSSSIELEANDYPDVYTVGCTFQQTLLNTYAAFIQKTTSSLLIYKNGVLLQTLTLTDLGLSSILAWAVSFSPRGKYIFITGTRVASGNKGWVVLVGS